VTRPLLICDCDEVLVHFAGPFANWLAAERALELSFESFALAGNIRRKSDGGVVDHSEIGALVDAFFEGAMHGQPAVAGAAEALETLSQHYRVVILSNIRDAFTERRAEQIRAHGMPFPVHCNSGPKGPAVCRLLAEYGAERAVFVDDLPPHHTSVKNDAVHVHRLHMVADPSLRSLIPAAPDAHIRIDIWAEALPYLSRLASRLPANRVEEVET
jgi:hypothetical protein